MGGGDTFRGPNNTKYTGHAGPKGGYPDVCTFKKIVSVTGPGFPTEVYLIIGVYVGPNIQSAWETRALWCCNLGWCSC
jgi:hypothetical protein